MQKIHNFVVYTFNCILCNIMYIIIKLYNHDNWYYFQSVMYSCKIYGRNSGKVDTFESTTQC